MKALRGRTWWFLGLLLALVPFGTSWAAGTPAGTVISNFATLSYRDVNGNALPNITSNTVTTVVAQVAGVDVSPATSSQSVAENSWVSYTATVTNMGNGTDSFTLTTSALSSGWTAVIYGDPNNNGVLDAGEMVPGNVVSTIASLPADSAKHVFVVVNVPLGALDGSSQAVTLTATSQFNTGVSDAGVYTSTVSTAVLSMTKSATPADPKPGDIVTYAIVGNNTGTSTAYGVVVKDIIPSGVTYVPGSTRIVIGPGGTYDTATPMTDAADADPVDYGVTAAGQVTVNWGNSPAGQTGTIFIRVQVNAGIAAGTVVSNQASATYSSTPGGDPLPAVNSTPGDITVAAKPIITLSNTSLALTGQPGDSLTYAFSLTNSGNSNDVFDFTTSSTQGFTNQIWLDANNDGIAGNDGDVPLTDTDSDGKVDTGSIPAGTVAHIIVALVVTPGTADMDVDATTVTVASSVDPTVTGTVTLTSTVHAPVLSIVKSVSPTGSQPPGTVLTYTVVVSNNGHGTATQLQIVDLIPTNTTYQAGTIKVNGTARTDAVDGDNAELQGGSVVVRFATMGAGSSNTFTFDVKID
ncbi:MAG TPA: hypothetical protein PLE60_06225 [Candidatus Latescibacteria bacterium]|nr:hypothetical protein [Candidatus Latescibacterota bacterium]